MEDVLQKLPKPGGLVLGAFLGMLTTAKACLFLDVPAIRRK